MCIHHLYFYIFAIYFSYKFVAVVTIGQKLDQGVKIGSRCVWNTDYDTWASASFESRTLYAVGNIYALYFE